MGNNNADAVKGGTKNVKGDMEIQFACAYEKLRYHRMKKVINK